MKKDKEKKEFLKFKQLPKELYNYFLLRFIFCGIIILSVIAFAIITKFWQGSMFLGAFSLLYIGTVLINFYSVISKKIKVYRGKFIKKVERDLNLGKKESKLSVNIKGPCSILLTPVEDDTSKYIVPIGNTFNADEGNTVIIYANPNDIYKRNDNSFYFQNTLLVRVEKI